jgi:hypothetical protein
MRTKLVTATLAGLLTLGVAAPAFAAGSTPGGKAADPATVAARCEKVKAALDRVPQATAKIDQALAKLDERVAAATAAGRTKAVEKLTAKRGELAQKRSALTARVATLQEKYTEKCSPAAN